MKAFLLAGHIGFYNRGCEAILRCTAEMLRRQFGPCRLILASSDVKGDSAEARALDVELVYGMAPRWSRGWFMRQCGRLIRAPWTWRYTFAPMMSAIRQADAVLSIGGDNYTSDYVGLNYYLHLNRLVKELGSRLVLWGASVGPFPDPTVRRDAAEALRIADLITARDTETVEYLAEMGLSGTVRRVADSAFILPVEPVDTSSFWPNGDRVLGVNTSPILARYRDDQSGQVVSTEVHELVRTATERLGLGVLFIPHVWGGPPSNDDYTALRPLLEPWTGNDRVQIVPPLYNASQTKYIISRCAFFLGARMHSTIAALSSRVPTISLSYSRKSVGLQHDLFGDGRYVVSVSGMAPGELAAALVRLHSEEQRVRERLAEIIPSMIEKAWLGVRYLAEVLGETQASGAPAAGATGE